MLFDGLTSALSNNSDIVIVDTAGRLHTYDNLMSELEKMHRISTKRFPQFIVKNIITIDSLLGQNSIVQAEQFNNHVPLDGAILTKLDGTAKGGIVFSLYKKVPLLTFVDVVVCISLNFSSLIIPTTNLSDKFSLSILDLHLNFNN